MYFMLLMKIGTLSVFALLCCFLGVDEIIAYEHGVPGIDGTGGAFLLSIDAKRGCVVYRDGKFSTFLDERKKKFSLLQKRED